MPHASTPQSLNLQPPGGEHNAAPDLLASTAQVVSAYADFDQYYELDSPGLSRDEVFGRFDALVDDIAYTFDVSPSQAMRAVRSAHDTLGPRPLPPIDAKRWTTRAAAHVANNLDVRLAGVLLRHFDQDGPARPAPLVFRFDIGEAHHVLTAQRIDEQWHLRRDRNGAPEQTISVQSVRAAAAQLQAWTIDILDTILAAEQ